MDNKSAKDLANTKKQTLRELELEYKKLQAKQEREKLKIMKQIEKEKSKKSNFEKRKIRNKLIYDIGGLLPTILGDDFEKLSTDPDFKNVIAGVIIRIQTELSNAGYGVDENGKKTWLEYHKGLGNDYWNDKNNKNLETKEKEIMNS